MTARRPLLLARTSLTFVTRILAFHCRLSLHTHYRSIAFVGAIDLTRWSDIDVCFAGGLRSDSHLVELF